MNSEYEFARTEDSQKSEKVKKLYFCPQCQKSCSHKSNLNKHMLIHSGEKPFVCPVCLRQFRQKSALNTHMHTHSVGKERTHMCNSCQKGFNQKSDLVRHERVHSGDKPYVCEICNKGFAEKNNLKNHLTVHSGEKPFSCPLCNKSFTQRHNLKYHLKKHLNEEEKVKKEVDDGLEQNKSDFCFEVPVIKQELIIEEDLEKPSCSYPMMNVKQEPTENADPACLNLCAGSFVTEEIELPTRI